MPSTVSSRDPSGSTSGVATPQATKAHASLLTRARSKAAYTFRHKLVLGVEPVWRYVANAGPTRAYRKTASQQTSALPPESARMLHDLNRDGCSRSTLEALTGDATLLGRLQETARAYESERAAEIAAQTKALAEVDDLGDGNAKLFLVQFLDARRPVIEPQGLLAVTALNPAIKAIADAYFAMRTRVADINIWRNLPSNHPPVSSQLWHRDQPDDYFVLKMFVYLEDVTDGAGPLSYGVGTHGKRERTWKPANTWHDGFNIRAHDVDMDSGLGESRRPRFTGPAGTVILADTQGWHKGGQATTTPRLLLQVLYASPAAADFRMLGAPADLDRSADLTDLAYDLSGKRG
ncbi:hypothetical protein acdb102_20090 [Acidothermaceae bacterium B102]|nr:hypothetical protein acdb102_20090 [Acidothermaceae bacterium B102]